MYSEQIVRGAVKSLDKNLWKSLHIKNTIRQVPTFTCGQVNNQLQANFEPFNNSKSILDYEKINQQVKPMKIKTEKWKKQIAKLIKSQHSPKSSIKNVSKMSLSASLRKSKILPVSKVRFSMKQMYSKLDNAQSVSSQSINLASNKFISCQQQQEYDPQIDELRKELLGVYEKDKKDQQSKLNKQRQKINKLQQQKAQLQNLKQFTFNYQGKFMPVKNQGKKLLKVNPICYKNIAPNHKKASRSKTEPTIIPNQRINDRLERLKIQQQSNLKSTQQGKYKAKYNFFNQFKQDMLLEGVTIKCMGKVQTKPRIRAIKTYTQCTLSEFKALQTTEKNTIFTKVLGKTMNTKVTQPQSDHTNKQNCKEVKQKGMSISLVMGGQKAIHKNNSLFMKKMKSYSQNNSNLAESLQIKQNIQENIQQPSFQISQLKSNITSQQITIKTQSQQVDKIKKYKLGRITVNSHKFFNDLIDS